ncbi:MAG: hypothetical protein BRC28_02745 [Nanohaloarchaea archaeon SW_4_43_9]|nr:MAG: hypothetical protein BRC28_02745 [Nanohaloarchaea archaeon SW_4_43_9]
MKRKGISPLIAAVLLIAFTMAVASIFAQWAPQLMEDAQGDTTERANEIQDCSDRTLEVDADLDNAQATITQTGGTEPIGNLTATFYYDDGSSPTQKTTRINDSSRGVTSLTINNPSTLREIQVQPTECQGAPAASWEPE